MARLRGHALILELDRNRNQSPVAHTALGNDTPGEVPHIARRTFQTVGTGSQGYPAAAQPSCCRAAPGAAADKGLPGRVAPRGTGLRAPQARTGRRPRSRSCRCRASPRHPSCRSVRRPPPGRRSGQPVHGDGPGAVVRAFLILAHQARIPGHIGGKDGGETAGRGHGWAGPLFESAVPLTVAQLVHRDMRPTNRGQPRGVTLRRTVRHSRGAVRRSRWAVVGRMGGEAMVMGIGRRGHGPSEVA